MKFSGCENFPKSWFKASELFIYSFIYLFIYFWNIGNTVYDHYEESEAAIHKCWKNSCWNLNNVQVCLNMSETEPETTVQAK